MLLYLIVFKTFCVIDLFKKARYKLREKDNAKKSKALSLS